MEYRGYAIRTAPYGALKIITTIGRGSLPLILRGEFTSDYMARKAIDIVAANKESTNGEDKIVNRD